MIKLNIELEQALKDLLTSEQIIEGVHRNYHEDIRRCSFDNYQILINDANTDEELCRALNTHWVNNSAGLLTILRNLRTNPINPYLYSALKNNTLPSPLYIWR